MDFKESVNIYSEPFFPTSQGYPIVAGSLPTQVTQTQTTQEASTSSKQRRSKDKLKGSYEQLSEGLKESDELEYDGSEASSFNFKLDNVVIRASKITQDYCTVGCPHLDNALGGGIPTFGITEFYGEAGSGKTQLCLQLAITAQLPITLGGLNAGGVYYICTQEALPVKRLQELVQHFKNKFPEDLPSDPMSNIFIDHVKESEALMQCIDIKLGGLARINREKKIRLVIIDSVAAIFRLECDDLIQRTFDLRKLAQTLHEHSQDHEAAVVVCNQVTGSPTVEGNVASLGTAWRNLITTRIHISKSETSERFLYVTFSPHIPSFKIPFRITANGVEGTPSAQL